MAIKINDYSYTPNGHFEDITVSGSYHNIISVSWTKTSNRRKQNIITTAVYENSASYAAGDQPFQSIGHGVNLTERSSNINIDGTFNDTIIDIPSGKQWIDNITSDSPSTNMLSASYEVLKSQVPMYSGSVHVVDVL